MAARAARVREVEGRVRELRRMEQELGAELGGQQERVVQTFWWEQESEKGEAAPQLFQWDVVESGFVAVQGHAVQQQTMSDEDEPEVNDIEGWNRLMEAKRDEVDVEWRIEGRFFNQNRTWSQKESQALEAEAWSRVDIAWREAAERKLVRRVTKLEKQVAALREGRRAELLCAEGALELRAELKRERARAANDEEPTFT